MAVKKEFLPTRVSGHQEAQKRRKTVSDEKLDELVEEFEWGGCGDNVGFGRRKAAQFMDINRRRAEASGGNITEAVYVHNFEAGQLVSALLRHK